MAATLDTESVVTLVTPVLRNNTRSASNLFLVYLQCFFVTIATILGTGILGLPVTLADSGLYPFLASFLAGFFVQALLICYFTDILQRAYAVQMNSVKTRGPENVPLNEMEADEDFDDIEEERETNGPVMAGHIIIPKDVHVKPPNLHLLGELFLPCGVRQLFDIVLFIQFIAILSSYTLAGSEAIGQLLLVNIALLISYALAGSEAYAEVMQVKYFYVIPVFVWILTFAIVFALPIIQPVVSILTFAKASLLLGTVVVTFSVGSSIHHEVSNNFSYIGEPFLMGTVALGGVINVMPFLYAKIAPVPGQVRGFKWAILMGLTTCTVLNVLWCWAVLDIVPQKNSCFTTTAGRNDSPSSSEGQEAWHHQQVCLQNISLKRSFEIGEISTVPLSRVIEKLYPQYRWVAGLVNWFIMISITVSFLTIGAAMHHTMCGWIESMWHRRDQFTHYAAKIKVSKRIKCCTSEILCRTLLSLMAFGIVFSIAMLDPKGFESMLEKAASLFINLEAGIFVFFMIRSAHSMEKRKLKIPLPLPDCAYCLQFFIPAYFGFAVFYDVFISVYRLGHPGELLPWEWASNIELLTNASGLTPAPSLLTTVSSLSTVAVSTATVLTSPEQ